MFLSKFPQRYYSLLIGFIIVVVVKLEFVRIYPTLAAAPEGDDDSDLPEDYLTAAEIIVKSVIGRSDVLTRWEESDEAFHLRGGCFNDLQAKVGDRILDLVRGGRLTDEVRERGVARLAG